MIDDICQAYYKNLQIYNEIENFDYVNLPSKHKILAALADNTKKKQEVYKDQNRLLYTLFALLDDEKFAITPERYQILNTFAKELSQSVLDLDNEVAFRIYEKLLEYGKSVKDYNLIVESAFWCGICEWKYFTLDPMDYSCTYFFEMNLYGEHFGELKKEVRRYYIAGIMNQILAYTHKDAGPLIQKGKEILQMLEEIEEKYPDTPVNFKAYRSTTYRNILTATESFCRRVDDSKENRMYVYDIAKRSIALITEKDDTTIPFNSEYYYDLYTAEFHAGKLNFEAFLGKLEGICQPHSDYSEKENFCCVFRHSGCYIDYIRNFCDPDSPYAKEKIKQRVSAVVCFAGKVERNEESAAVNRYIFKFVEQTLDLIPFQSVRELLFRLMMNQHRETCVHNLMVDKISRELLNAVMHYKPEELLGVCGYDTLQEVLDHRFELIGLMKDMALTHDIGKYRCINIVSNSSRRLTDREFQVIKRHSEYGYQMLEKANISDAIKDGVLYHHRWHDAGGGYPMGYASTKNQPLIDILSIADSLDAATDTYGRAYSVTKTLDQLIEEMKTEKRRYSEQVVCVLEKDDVKKGVQYLLKEKRDSLHIFVCRKQCEEMMKDYHEKGALVV